MSRSLFGSTATLAAALSLSACGVIKYNVNGREHTLGESSTPTAAAASTPATTTASAKPAAPTADGDEPAPPTTVASGPVQTLLLDNTLTASPRLYDPGKVTVDASVGKVLGTGAIGRVPCSGSDLPSRPIAIIEVKPGAGQAHLAVPGSEAFILKKGDQFWSACDAEMGPPKGGWEPGRYEIYPIARYATDDHYRPRVELWDPSVPAPAAADQVKLSLAGKLAEPRFVEITLPASRRVLRQGLAGDGCTKAAFGDAADLVLTLERPIPGLVIRPLPTATPVTLRRDRTQGERTSRWCNTYSTNNGRRHGEPSFFTASHIGFDNGEEGTINVSVGDDPQHPEGKVTLMIYDTSTAFQPQTLRLVPGAVEVADRQLDRHFPQLDVATIRQPNAASADLAAAIFAAAPKELLVYSKLDLDKDIASSDSTAPDVFPHKDEPLLVVDHGKDQTVVLTADGLFIRVKTSHLLPAPTTAPAPVTTPRPLAKDLRWDSAAALAPASAKPILDGLAAEAKRHESCVERVWAPYGNQLPTISRPAGVDIVYVESAHTRQIREAGDRAVDRACGTSEVVDKARDKARIKLLAEIEKARAKRLAAIKAP
jgi:hypothetical protein